ncbi:hypothetical protein IU11_03420, partial [Cellulosimicrobium sp. MM]
MSTRAWRGEDCIWRPTGGTTGSVVATTEPTRASSRSSTPTVQDAAAPRGSRVTTSASATTAPERQAGAPAPGHRGAPTSAAPRRARSARDSPAPGHPVTGASGDAPAATTVDP